MHQNMFGGRATNRHKEVAYSTPSDPPLDWEKGQKKRRDCLWEEVEEKVKEWENEEREREV